MGGGNVCWLIREVGWPHCFGGFLAQTHHSLNIFLHYHHFLFCLFLLSGLFPYFLSANSYSFPFPCSFDYSVLQSIVFLRHPKATELLTTLVGWSLLRLSRYLPPIWLLELNLVWIKDKEKRKTTHPPPSTHTQTHIHNAFINLPGIIAGRLWSSRCSGPP